LGDEKKYRGAFAPLYAPLGGMGENEKMRI
jgi:hypothetical protein